MCPQQLSHLDVKDWTYNLLTAMISGGAGAVSAAIAGAVIDPTKLNLAGVESLKLMGWTFAISALLKMFNFLSSTPLPAIIQDNVARIDAIEARNAVKDSPQGLLATKDLMKSVVQEVIPSIIKPM